ncbi:MAG TPA: hypothetical protein VE571_10330 [Solirubrobacteraceae bacterium]|nr:hypothetical protein [Solirubrobacteraceae bacterium]
MRFVTPPARGTIRLLVGMVRANRPWRLILGLLGALTAAVATATLANLTVTVWRVATGLCAFNLLTGVLVIAARPLHSALGHAPALGDHVRLAWFVSSVATVGGALGSGLESNAAVRAAAYRYQAEEDA